MVKVMMFEEAFNNDGGSASGSPSRMVGVLDCIFGESKIAFVRKVRLGVEHDVYVAQRKKCFQLLCVLI
jgi:hypothetical protein